MNFVVKIIIIEKVAFGCKNSYGKVNICVKKLEGIIQVSTKLDLKACQDKSLAQEER